MALVNQHQCFYGFSRSVTSFSLEIHRKNNCFVQRNVVLPASCVSDTPLHAEHRNFPSWFVSFTSCIFSWTKCKILRGRDYRLVFVQHAAQWGPILTGASQPCYPTNNKYVDSYMRSQSRVVEPAVQGAENAHLRQSTPAACRIQTVRTETNCTACWCKC